ncbi:putative GNAT family N-acetyltransferase [Cercophora newfieldiana]|uniref:GNAT family N-acetyltransferase n=1 Tax=Cercophora newfieldiana TaxID=92897 RepID=A0AA40CV61_9PEZI|nr:putative GNAT family N-acetyltransferase [Cercophora newfieldiana]
MSLPSLPAGYTFHSGSLPSVPQYRYLRAASGLTPMTEAQSVAVPKGTWFGCYVTSDADNGTAVAMGRIISDGGWYFVIADMAVLPTHQRKGLGDTILKHLLRYIKENAPEGEPFVSLTADPPGRKLYERNGFVESAPKEVGMMLLDGWRDRL